MKLKSGIISALCLAAALLAGAELTIAENGVAKAGILVPENTKPVVKLAAPVSMILPISTPPNAIAHSTGFIDQKDMMKVGIIVGLLGIVLGYAMLIFIGF